MRSFSRREWLCIGDFNEIVDNSEKVGGLWRLETQLAGFKNSLADCNLGDLGFSSSKFTWSNKRNSTDFIKERLDQALATRGGVVIIISLELRFWPLELQTTSLFGCGFQPPLLKNVGQNLSDLKLNRMWMRGVQRWSKRCKIGLVKRGIPWVEFCLSWPPVVRPLPTRVVSNLELWTLPLTV